MRIIDTDLKKLIDELTEVRNTYNQLVKKDGTTYMTKDIAEVIYGDPNLKPEDHFPEYHSS